MRYIPILGGTVAALGVIAAVALAPHMPSQASLAPEETALLAEWTRVGDALAVQRMVEQGACVEAVSADGTTALMTAAGEGYLAVYVARGEAVLGGRKIPAGTSFLMLPGSVAGISGDDAVLLQTRVNPN